MKEPIPVPVFAPIKEGREQATGFKTITYEECEKILLDVKKNKPAFLWRNAVSERLGIWEIDLLESMFITMDSNRPIHKLFPGSTKSLNAYIQYRTVFDASRGQTITYEHLAQQVGNTVPGVQGYIRSYPGLPAAFGVTMIYTVPARSSSIVTREKPKVKERVDYPALYKRAIEAAAITYQRKSQSGEFPDPKNITAEIVYPEIKGPVRVPLFAIRSYLIENLKRDPDFIKKILDEMHAKET